MSLNLPTAKKRFTLKKDYFLLSAAKNAAQKSAQKKITTLAVLKKVSLKGAKPTRDINMPSKKQLLKDIVELRAKNREISEALIRIDKKATECFDYLYVSNYFTDDRYLKEGEEKFIKRSEAVSIRRLMTGFMGQNYVRVVYCTKRSAKWYASMISDWEKECREFEKKEKEVEAKKKVLLQPNAMIVHPGGNFGLYIGQNYRGGLDLGCASS